ncbi:MAG: phosphatidylserine decarboxylase family protein [Bacteroidales bacterium]|nr:phosphatidylserine decarboxylase family protein [Bacteroidales bacterium]
MIIHKQGIKIILVFLILLIIVNLASSHFFSEKKALNIIVNSFSVLLFTLIIVFFRNPKRTVKENEFFVFSPADGTVVTIEKVQEDEYFNDQRIQISIFMSIFNVHKNWIPISGQITYAKYHKGKYLMAHLPKSSVLNERNSIVIKNKKNEEILVKQIAGLIARRIVCNVKVNDNVHQDQELGFIKFGSRLDVFLPLNSIVKVNIGDKVVGGLTVLADLIPE